VKKILVKYFLPDKNSFNWTFQLRIRYLFPGIEYQLWGSSNGY